MSREETLKELEELGLDPTLINEGVSDELLSQFLALAKPKNEVPKQMNDLTRDEMIAALVEAGHSQEDLAAMDDAALSALYDAELGGGEEAQAESEFADDEEPLPDEEQVGTVPGADEPEDEEVEMMAERDEMVAALVAAGVPQEQVDQLSDEELAALFAQLQEMAAQEAAPAAPATTPMSERRTRGKLVRFSDVTRLVNAVARGLESRLTRKFARTVRRANQLHRDTKHKSVVAFCERLQEEGRLLPAEFDRTVARLLRANDEKKVRQFSDGKFVSKTELEIQMEELKARPILVQFAERMKQPVGQHDGEKAQVEAHFTAFSETYTRLGQTKESFVKGFELARKQNPRLTAKDFCSGKG